MNLFTRFKMKYRLLALIFLPSLILLGFIIDFLYQDYSTISRMNEIRRLSYLIDYTGNLVENILDERDLSLIHAAAKENQISKELSEARLTTDKILQKLKDYLQSISYIHYKKSFLEAFKKTLEKIDQINEKRDQVDNLKASINEISLFYDGIKNDLIHRISDAVDIAQENIDLNIGRVLVCYFDLLQIYSFGGDERKILYFAFLGNQISNENYSSLLYSIGEQKAFHESFQNLASEQEDEIYDKILKSSFVSEVNKFRQVLIPSIPSEKFGVNPNRWWEAKSNELNLIKEIQKQVLSVNDLETARLVYDKFLYLWTKVIAIIVIFVITLILVFFTLRSLTNKLQEEVEILSTSGQEILNSIVQASSGTTETATAVTETTTTVEELKQTAQVASEKAKNVSEVSDEALQILKDSEKSLEATIQGMNRIQEEMGTISESIVKLSGHSQAIGEIIDTVNDFAEQSHLLAVNAAIEAAKAGDQGKGFAVVAQEVRSLAEQSKQATTQVRNILNDIQNATNSAVMATEQGSKAVSNGVNQSLQTTESIKSIASGITKVAQAASQIAISSQQQVIGVGQVTIAMKNIREASNQQVENMQQIETGVQNLNNVGHSLKNLILEYKM